MNTKHLPGVGEWAVINAPWSGFPSEVWLLERYFIGSGRLAALINYFANGTYYWRVWRDVTGPEPFEQNAEIDPDVAKQKVEASLAQVLPATYREPLDALIHRFEELALAASTRATDARVESDTWIHAIKIAKGLEK